MLASFIVTLVVAHMDPRMTSTRELSRAVSLMVVILILAFRFMFGHGIRDFEFVESQPLANMLNNMSRPALNYFNHASAYLVFGAFLVCFGGVLGYTSFRLFAEFASFLARVMMTAPIQCTLALRAAPGHFGFERSRSW